MREDIPVLGPSSKNSVIQVNPQLRINLFLKKEGAGAKALFSLRHTPGLILKDTATSGTGRSNGVQWDNKDWFVIGQKLVSIDSNGIMVEVGDLLTAGSRCELAAGRDHIMVVDGTYGYAWDGATFTSNIQSADSDFPDNPSHCRYLDGFFLVNEVGTGNFYKSASENPVAGGWDALEFEVASAAPDDVLALEVFDRDAFLFGQYTTQPYTNTGDTDFPFSPYPNTIQAGILAPHSAAVSKLGVCFLANTKDGDVTVELLAGTSMTTISDEDINDRLGELTGLSSAIGSIYSQKGRTFYCLTFPADDVTLVCDLTGGFLWHDRSSLVDGVAGRWRVNGIGYLSGNKVYAVDSLNANLYELSLSTYTENGETIQRENYTQIIHNKGDRFTIHSLEYQMRRGVGLESGQGSAPVLMMRVSKDGGETYSEFRHKAFGQQGQYRKRAAYKRVGEYENFNHHLRITDPVPIAIMGAVADIEWGYS
jgi:hypothetical protein